MNTDMTIAAMMNYYQPLHQQTACHRALDIFMRDSNLFAIPIVDNRNYPVGVIERAAFTEVFIKDFSKELHGKKPVSQLMDESPLIVDIHSSLEEVARIVADAKKRYLLSGFIVTVSEQYAGMGNIHDLIAELSKIRHNNLFYLAHIDQLTQLPNRLLFNDRLEKALLDKKRLSSEVAIIFIDVDNFKYFNDSLGHGFGDKLLQAFAKRLTNNARANDTVARLAGDEFVILMDHINDESCVETVSHRIIDSTKQPLIVNDNEFYISASVGFAISAEHDNANTLLLKADSAMYLAKKLGKNNCKKYDAGVSIKMTNEGNAINQLHSALMNHEFILHYQPQYDAQTGEIVGKEALIRWQHPHRGLLSPIHFIELCEKSGLIIEIGASVFHQAFKQQKLWSMAPTYDQTAVSINVSAIQLFQEKFSGQVYQMVDAVGLQPQSVCIELTESMLLHDLDGAIRVLNELKHYGFSIALDDFGTGYSNLSYLKRLPIDKLKIDQTFVRNIDQDMHNQVIVKAIHSIAKALNFTVIAEGVETPDELSTIRALGIHLVQGYIYSRPLSTESLTQKLQISIQDCA